MCAESKAMQIPPYHATLDQMSNMLDSRGVMGVVDFYTKRAKDGDSSSVSIAHSTCVDPSDVSS